MSNLSYSTGDRMEELKRFLTENNFEFDDALIHKLYNMHFFDAPASTKYHGAYRGGLFDHSMLVARKLLELTKNNKLNWLNPRSPILVGLFHDLCKCDQYDIDEQTSRITWHNEQLLNGHGAKSVIILSTLFKLTSEEVMCIRYHMGAFSDDDTERGMYGENVTRYPNILWTHTADMIASRIYQI